MNILNYAGICLIGYYFIRNALCNYALKEQNKIIENLKKNAIAHVQDNFQRYLIERDCVIIERKEYEKLIEIWRLAEEVD